MAIVAPPPSTYGDVRGDARPAWPSAKCEYTLRACIALAGADPVRRITAAEIAELADVPRDYLARILAELRAAGILSSQPGYRGGYSLALPPSAIPLVSVLAAVGVPDPFGRTRRRCDARVPFLDELCERLRAVAIEAFENASLAELLPPRALEPID